MYRKFLAASVLTIGLATSAMAQSSDGTYSNRHSWWPFGNEQSSSVDQNTTGSINGDTAGNPGGPAGPCAYSSAGPDANHQGNVNDQYCGK
ncbi:hypothetical protein [Mesorhizobium carmichaelinearum]|uniref:hypothetical protein n=1 Tax=Mesorhizobium carmichaelinearum TaxID=1208188 RepID=UPI000BA4C43F|nr:hypothetical protein [Mesorhizobium carmichaelinearum]